MLVALAHLLTPCTRTLLVALIQLLKTATHTSVVDGKETTTKHPVAYISGLFHGSQLNWAAMTKEAYAIYMTVKKSTFYITGHDVTLRSDHLPLNKFT